ncbi:MAG: mechanosensitive ion channel family protein [Nanoarchaeota archaeon]|nr:mechanosensitive ion channel family protein [Nanoarchaeota archaeon]
MLDLIITFFSKQISDNYIYEITIAILLLCLYPIISRIINFIVKNYFEKWINRTTTKIDSIILSSIVPSINLFILAGLFYIGVMQLQLGGLQAVMDTIFNLLLIIPIVFFLIKFATQSISYYFSGKGKEAKFNEAAVDILMQVVQVAFVVIGILLILSNLGYNISALLTGLGIGGLAFALASQDLLKNFFAGISLVFDKAFNKGERVKFDKYSGRIEEVRLRSTKLRTFEGTLLTIPNTKLSDNVVENVSQIPKVRVSMTIGVEYSTSSKKLKQAKEIIYNAIKNNEHADEEKAWIYFDNFSAYSLDIQVIYFAKELTMEDWPKRVQFKEEINFEIKEKFEKAGIVFAFPTQTIHINK